MNLLLVDVRYVVEVIEHEQPYHMVAKVRRSEALAQEPGVNQVFEGFIRLTVVPQRGFDEAKGASRVDPSGKDGEGRFRGVGSTEIDRVSLMACPHECTENERKTTEDVCMNCVLTPRGCH